MLIPQALFHEARMIVYDDPSAILTSQENMGDNSDCGEANTSGDIPRPP